MTLIAIPWFLAVGVASAAPLGAGTQATFEALAGKVRYFVPDSFVWDRPPGASSYVPDEAAEEYAGHLRTLADARHPAANLVALLRHPDPRVRTLALAALYARGDHRALPAIATLMADPAATYPVPPDPLSAEIRVPAARKFDLSKFQPQTVGDVATRLVEFYAGRSGTTAAGDRLSPAEFNSYWQARKGRPHCATWYAVRLARATGGIRPVEADRAGRVREFVRALDRLPPDDRAWTVLLLTDDLADGALGAGVLTDKQLLAAVNPLGPDKLLAMLRREAPTDDPDWLYHQKAGTWAYQRAVHFVLDHAADLLRPQDAGVLLAYEAQERKSVAAGNVNATLTARWALAAARLAPDRAAGVLHDAFRRYPKSYHSLDRAALAAALWERSGAGETAFLVDWFYAEQPHLGVHGGGRGGFLAWLRKRPRPDPRPLVAAVVRDPRFADLDWYSLRRVAELVNTWVKKPVVTPVDLEAAWHPYGDGHMTAVWLAKARAEYPKETDKLLTTLAGWRAAVRASVPEWSAPAAKP